jgi:hypothetical protein
MIRGDLHVHSRRSDGSYTVEDAVSLARERGLAFISFTDHDTVDGALEAVALGEALGVTVIPGIEISAWDSFRNRRVHLLGYGYDPAAPNIRRLCGPLLEARHANTLRQWAVLGLLGYRIGEDELRAAVGGAPVLYKQHLMKALKDAGTADGIYGSLYHQLFKEGGPASGDIRYVDAFDALKAIQADGGLAVLAHPGQLDSWDIAAELAGRGLAGIEAYHESHTGEDCGRALALARRHGLFVTGGSDDHGDLGSTLHLGEVHCPPDLVYRLVAREHPDLAAALPVVLAAGKRLRSASARFRAPDACPVEQKGGNPQDLVTRWDRETEAHIIAGLRERFPGCMVVAEEESEGRAEPESTLPPGRVWILDPVDGTVNFVRTGRDFAVSLALYIDGEPEAGVVLDCETGRLYTAVRGRGARVDGRRIVPLPANGSETTSLPGLVDMGLNTLLHFRDRAMDLKTLNASIGGHRASGCASLSLCRVADGTLDLYASAKLSIWDWAAAALILAECGRPAWIGPARNPAQGFRGKTFYMAARSEAAGEGFLGLLGDGEFLASLRRQSLLSIYN